MKDADANDMIHMGSDHRCVMATLTISTLGKILSQRKQKVHHNTKKKKVRKLKTISKLICPSSENDTQMSLK